MVHHTNPDVESCDDTVAQTNETSQSVPALSTLSIFREQYYTCLTARADALFELTDAALCADGPVISPVELSLAGEHRRGHGSVYAALNDGRVDQDALRDVLAAQPLPRAGGIGVNGRARIVLAVDVTSWLRPEAPTSAGRSFCHVYGRGRGNAQLIPGWQYSYIAALESGATSWTALLDIQRLHPDDDVSLITATQLRTIVERLQRNGTHRSDDPDILVVTDAGYDIPRLSVLLNDLPIHLLGRVRSNRVFYRPAPTIPRKGPGRRAHHGAKMTLTDPSTWPQPSQVTTNDTTRYGTATATSFDRLHVKLAHRTNWADHTGKLPILDATIIRLQVQHLPGQREATPIWLYSSTTDLSAEEVDECWQMFCRRFDLEHTFRMLKQTLGWTRAKLRAPTTADRWTWLVVVAYTQLRLARTLVIDQPRPWQTAAPSIRHRTPARVRRGFRNLHRTLFNPAGAPKPTRPGPGRPPGRRNTHHATHHPVGKSTRSDHMITKSED